MCFNCSLLLNRNRSNFHILILYCKPCWTCLLDVTVYSRFQRILYIQKSHCLTVIFTSFFPIWTPILSSSCTAEQARTCSTMLNRYGYLGLAVSDHQIRLINIWYYLWHLIREFYYIERMLMNSYLKGYLLGLSNAISSSIKMIQFLAPLLYWYNMLCQVPHVKLILHFQSQVSLATVYHPFICC